MFRKVISTQREGLVDTRHSGGSKFKVGEGGEPLVLYESGGGGHNIIINLKK